MQHILASLLLGFGTGLGLIVAIGAQNAYVLRLGITGPLRAIAAAVAICALSDAVLIFAGVLGIGMLIEQLPVALVVLRILGAGFLLTYGLIAARRAMRPAALTVDVPPTETSSTGATAVLTQTQPRLRTVVLTTLAFTWLNPHVYLDTVLFIGSIANQQGALTWVWASGAMAASCVWFAALGFGAGRLRPIFARPSAWRVLDSIIAVIMIGLGLKLAIWG